MSRPIPLAGPNPLPPERMSVEERLDEVAAILAAGLMRLTEAKSSRLSATRGESSLDFSAHQSVHATVSNGGGKHA
jgi:hypothetical protein